MSTSVTPLAFLLLAACGSSSATVEPTDAHEAGAEYVVFSPPEPVPTVMGDASGEATALCASPSDTVVSGSCFATNLAVTVTTSAAVDGGWRCVGAPAYVRAAGYINARVVCQP